MADNDIMFRFLKATWLPIAVFGVLSRLEVSRACGSMLYFGPTVVALAVVPPVWWWFVTGKGRPRIGRAALAGATFAFLILALTKVIASAGGEAHSSIHGDAVREALGNLELAFTILFATLIGWPIGAGVGALVAFVQTRCWSYPPEKRRTSDSMLDGAMRGGMVATLVAPFATYLAIVVLPHSLLPMSPGLTPRLGILLTAGWLVMVPAGAVLGMNRVRRRRHIDAARRASTTEGADNLAA